jgi:hypothetical protein
MAFQVPVVPASISDNPKLVLEISLKKNRRGIIVRVDQILYMMVADRGGNWSGRVGTILTF